MLERDALAAEQEARYEAELEQQKERAQASRELLAKTIQEEIDNEMLQAAEVDDEDEDEDEEAFSAWKVRLEYSLCYRIGSF